MSNRIEQSLSRKNGGNQSEMARHIGVSPQAVQKWIAGESEPRGENLAKAAQFLGVTQSYLKFGDQSEQQAPAVSPALGSDGEKRQVPRTQPFVHSLVSAYDGDDEVPEDVVLVPESRIEFAAGDGAIFYELVEHEEPASYRRAWFRKYGINPDKVKRFRVSGDSQEPYLFDRDTILVNMDETQIVDGRLYALRYGDQLRVKFLSRRIDGTLVLRSMNPAYKDEEISAEMANEHIEVIGRVRDRSGTGGL